MSPPVDRDAIDAFLGEHGTDVLSLAGRDTPYAVPVSYGYDSTRRAFYLRLSSHPESRKREFLAGPTEGRLVVYDRVDGEWVSVTAAGQIAEVGAAEVTSRVAEALRRAELPRLDLVDEPPDEVEVRVFRLTVETLSGRTTGTTDGGSTDRPAPLRRCTDAVRRGRHSAPRPGWCPASPRRRRRSP